MISALFEQNYVHLKFVFKIINLNYFIVIFSNITIIIESVKFYV